MKIDVVILSYAKNESIIDMNNNCINSINNSSEEHTFNIFLIETESSKEFVYSQKNVTVIQPNVEFAYNKFLNIGLNQCTTDWMLISNNDVVYEKYFIDNMLKAHQSNPQILSMSPIDDTWDYQKHFNRTVPIHYGYKVQHHLVGWSIFIHKKVLETIGMFDENYTFWYQDNDYSNMLNKYKITHALITNSKVKHLLSVSNHMLKNWNEMVRDSEIYFIKKWKN